MLIITVPVEMQITEPLVGAALDKVRNIVVRSDETMSCIFLKFFSIKLPILKGEGTPLYERYFLQVRPVQLIGSPAIIGGTYDQ